MNVHFMCAYYSQWAHENLGERSQAQWHSYKFCRAVKHGTINKFLMFPWKEKPWERIDSSNVHRAREIFGDFLERTINGTGFKDISIIPVPSKCGLVDAGTYRALEMVQKSLAASRWQSSIESILRFTTPLKKASEGGSRERAFLREHMRLTHHPRSDNILLVDDLITTGGSLLAAYDVLAHWKHPPALAICCGLTVTDSLIAPFGHYMKVYDPNPPAF